MLSQDRRIQRNFFSKILKEGKRYNSKHFLLYLLKYNKKSSRFSFSVSKKVTKLAVDRNKYRRRGYSLVSKYLPNIKPGSLFFFLFKKGDKKLTFNEMEKEIIYLLRETSMLV